MFLAYDEIGFDINVQYPIHIMKSENLGFHREDLCQLLCNAS